MSTNSMFIDTNNYKRVVELHLMSQDSESNSDADLQKIHSRKGT